MTRLGERCYRFDAGVSIRPSLNGWVWTVHLGFGNHVWDWSHVFKGRP